MVMLLAYIEDWEKLLKSYQLLKKEANRTDITVKTQRKLYSSVSNIRADIVTKGWVLLFKFSEFIDKNRSYHGEKLYDCGFMYSLDHYIICDMIDKPEKDAFLIKGHRDFELYPQGPYHYLIPKDWMRDPVEFINKRYNKIKNIRLSEEKDVINNKKLKLLESLKEFRDDLEFTDSVVTLLVGNKYISERGI